jgi:DNA-binding response OmpR family regulator
VKRLLLVEDEPGLVLTLRDRLTREGYSDDLFRSRFRFVAAENHSWPADALKIHDSRCRFQGAGHHDSAH